jgi:DNA-binding MarR family transcriptional regulator
VARAPHSPRNQRPTIAPADAPTSLRKGMLPSLLGYHLRRAQVAVFQNFTQAMAEFDVTPGQFGVLQVVSANPGLSQTELARAIGIDRSTMVAVIDRLEARGFVIRAAAPIDRRSYALRLSDSGAAALRAMEDRVRAHEREIAHDLRPAEQAQLIDLLSRIGVRD